MGIFNNNSYLCEADLRLSSFQAMRTFLYFFIKNRVTYYSWGGVNIISQTKGRINRFLWPAKVF